MKLVTNKSGKPITTSLIVAEIFNKRHDHILRDIQVIQNTLKSLGNSLPNFGESTYLNYRGKEYPMVEMDRDAFTLLTFGFTGARALQFKLQFIKAFNEMELELLKSKTKIPTLPELLRQAADIIEAAKKSSAKQTTIKNEMILIQLPRHKEVRSLQTTLGNMGFRPKRTANFLVQEGYLDFIKDKYRENCTLKIPTPKGEKYFVSQINQGVYVLPEGIKMLQEKRDTGYFPKECLKKIPA